MGTQVAQVGAYKRRTDGDITRWLTAVDWLMRNARHYDWTKPKHDVVNLRYGRDFLQEIEQYDIVVLHDIYDGTLSNYQLDHVVGAPRVFTRQAKMALRTSPLQTVGAWAWRLARTGAEYIFVFEMSPACINGWNLGSLNGYDTVHQDHIFTVYRKEAQNGNS